MRFSRTSISSRVMYSPFGFIYDVSPRYLEKNLLQANSLCAKSLLNMRTLVSTLCATPAGSSPVKHFSEYSHARVDGCPAPEVRIAGVSKLTTAINRRTLMIATAFHLGIFSPTAKIREALGTWQ